MSNKIRSRRHKPLMAGVAVVAAAGIGVATTMLAPSGSPAGGARLVAAARTTPPAGTADTATPIKHLVVIFDENVSFDHYFGTYPDALNPPHDPAFHAAPGTPSVNGLDRALLTENPNLSNPQRLGRSQALTCDQDHNYTPEQSAFDHGLMDHFVQDTNNTTDDTVALCTGKATGTSPNYTVMDYYDGNTVTGMWNYAQHFAMSDNAYGSAFGPSSPGAIEVGAANTYGAVCGPPGAVYGSVALCPATTVDGKSVPYSVASDPGHPAPAGVGTDYNDRDPYFDVCSQVYGGGLVEMGGRNVGDLLDAKGVSWGWFEGGFADGFVPGSGATWNPDNPNLCRESHQNIGGHTVTDYIPHHNPFQFYRSTANPEHLPPTSVAAIGHQDQANHQYGIGDFWAAADSGNLPAVSYVKPPGYEDGHPGYSDPLDEQHFVTTTIDRLEKLPSWRSTAVVINYDDSDGWYDQQMGPILRQSQTPLDTLTGQAQCGDNPAKVPTTSTGTPEEARCGLGPRLPFLVISPFAKQNYVSNRIIEQASIVRFIEHNWKLGHLGDGSAAATAGSILDMFDFTAPPAPRLFLDPITGEPVQGPPPGPHPGPRPSSRTAAGGRSNGGRQRPIETTSVGGPVVTLHPMAWWPERLTPGEQGAAPA